MKASITRQHLNARGTRKLAGLFLAALAAAGPLAAQTAPAHGMERLNARPPQLSALYPQEINKMFQTPGGEAGFVQYSLNARMVGGIPRPDSDDRDGIVDTGCGGYARELGMGVPPTREEAMVVDARYFDLMALGRPGRPTSYMLPDGSGLYSLLPFHVEEVIRNNPAAPVSPGTTITMARRGGMLRIGDVTMRTVCRGDPRFFQPGRQYVLFLMYIPKVHLYRIAEGYEFVKGKAVGIGPGGKDYLDLSGPPVIGMEKTDLLQLLRTAVLNAFHGKEQP